MYPIPKQAHQIEYEVKKSRFIARADYASTREQAMQQLVLAQQDYPDARHYCWAYLLGDPANAASAAMSDDGEPSGTAGKPILNVMQHKGIGDVMLIVVRYFGGIKLGAGGLVRAYSAAAQQVMVTLEVMERVAMSRMSARIEFAQEQFLRHWVAQHDGQIDAVEYGARNVLVVAILPEQHAHAFTLMLAANGMEHVSE